MIAEVHPYSVRPLSPPIPPFRGQGLPGWGLVRGQGIRGWATPVVEPVWLPEGRPRLGGSRLAGKVVSWTQAGHGAPLDVWVRFPAVGVEAVGTLVAVQGFSQDPLEQLEAWGGLADEEGWVVVVPVFGMEGHPGYQSLAVGVGPTTSGGRPLRSDEVLHQLLGWLDGVHGDLPRRLVLFGHGGGAQFVHRFALLHPWDLAAVVVSSAGGYTFPDRTLLFPRGLRLPTDWVGACQLRSLVGIPLLVTVGGGDGGRGVDPGDGSGARDGRALERVRLARRWVEALGTEAGRAGWVCRVELEELAGAGEGFGESLEAGLVSVVRGFVRRHAGYFGACGRWKREAA